MKKAVVICGPTAVGKTSIGLKIAKEKNGSLISADAVQVFNTLDIISGKDKDEFGDIPVKLIDIVSPVESFSVSQFEKHAKMEIKSICNAGKLPIIVGGTGLYVKAIVDGIPTSRVKPDFKLREELEILTLETLQNRLLNLDAKTFNSMNESDRKNKRRIIRKIEIAGDGIKNQPASPSLGGELRIKNENKLEFLQIGLELSREELIKRIDLRVNERIKQGAWKEAKDLFENYDNLTQQVKDANGYKQLFEHFLGNNTLDEAIEKWKLSEYKHAKNQMTWFKKDTRIKWYDAERKDLIEAVSSEIDAFL